MATGLERQWYVTLIATDFAFSGAAVRRPAWRALGIDMEEATLYKNDTTTNFAFCGVVRPASRALEGSTWKKLECVKIV
jgi:hypothetical protein